MIGRGIADHVAARHQIEPSAGEQSAQTGQILHRGNVYRNLIGEQIHIQLIGHGHIGNLPPQQLGKGLLAPGKFVDGQIDLKTHLADLLHDTLVPRAEGVKGAGEEGRRLFLRQGKGTVAHLTVHQKTIDVVHDRRLGKEIKVARMGFFQQRQQLFTYEQEIVPSGLNGDIVVCKNVFTQHRQRRLMNSVIVVRHAGQQQPQNPSGAPSLILMREHGQKAAQRLQTGCGTLDVARADIALQKTEALVQLLVRKPSHEYAQISGHIGRDFLLPRFQFSQQIHGDLILLIHPQSVGHLQQRPARTLSHGQMLADGQQVGQVHGRVESNLRVSSGLVAQCLHLSQLYHPVNGVFQVAQKKLGDGSVRHGGGKTYAVAQIGHGIAVGLRKGCQCRLHPCKLGIAEPWTHGLQSAQNQHLQRLVGLGEHPQQTLQYAFHPPGADGIQRYIVQLDLLGVGKNERLLVFGKLKPLAVALCIQQALPKRLQIVDTLGLVTVFHEAGGDDF